MNNAFNNISRLKEMMSAVKNPHMILSQMANTNPDLASVLQTSNSDGVVPRTSAIFFSFVADKSLLPISM